MRSAAGRCTTPPRAAARTARPPGVEQADRRGRDNPLLDPLSHHPHFHRHRRALGREEAVDRAPLPGVQRLPNQITTGKGPAALSRQKDVEHLVGMGTVGDVGLAGNRLGHGGAAQRHDQAERQ